MTLHVERLGAGPDLVLLHGWALHGGVWSSVAARLASRFRVHVIDLPGHGHSHAETFSDLDGLAAGVAGAVPAGSAVCGWSLGAQVAMKLASIARLGVRRLGLVAATPSFVSREGWSPGIAPETLAAFARDLVRGRDRTVRAFLHLNARGAPGTKACIRQLEGLLAQRPTADDAALATGLDVLAMTDLRAESARLRQPALVIQGLCDELVPAGAGQRLAASMPNARFVGIDDAPHAVLLTHADAVASALERIDG